MMVCEEDGAGAGDIFPRTSDLTGYGTFQGLLQWLMNPIPRASRASRVELADTADEDPEDDAKGDE